MDLKSLITKPKESKVYYWALLLEPSWVSSAIWEIQDGKVEVINSSLGTRWEDDESLLTAIDASLTSCSQILPEDVDDPTKTVFGVTASWMEEGNIKEEYLLKLKKICQDLSLTPSGFVVLSEAIAHYIKSEEEAPLSGIVMGVSDDNLDFSIFNQGKLLGTTIVARSVSIEEDALEGLSRLSGGIDNLPSRIILYNQKESELEEIKSSLNEVDWSKLQVSRFMHAPKIEILDPSKKVLAVALAGGSEMGEVTGVVSREENDLISDEVLPEVENIKETNDLTPEDLGFVVSGTAEPMVSGVKTDNNNSVPEPAKYPAGSASEPRKLNINFPKPALPKINFRKPNINFSFGSKPLVMGGSTILTFIVAGFLLWWFVPKASVTVYVAPKKLEESVTLTLNNSLQSKTIEESVSGEKASATTGTKTVGDKAKGQLKIQNGTSFPINLPAGTAILSSSDLKFVTTQSASVSGALSPSSPGTAVVSIEAAAIGSEYNLAKDEVFKVANYPKAEVDGTATDNLSGGSSRQISAVSEDDRKKILEGLKEELLESAKSKLIDKTSGDEVLVDASIEEEVEDEDFSNKVGDEASNLNLSLTVKYKATVLSKNELAKIAKSNLESKVPSGFILRDDQINYEFANSDNEGSLDTRISVNLLPNVDPNDVAKKITGKYPDVAESYLGSVPGFVRAEFRLRPLLPGKLGTLPHVSKNISVELSSER